jgi:hypothetical protein
LETNIVKSVYEKLSAFQIHLATTIIVFQSSRLLRIVVIGLLPIVIAMLVVAFRLIIKGLFNGWDADRLSIILGIILMFSHACLLRIYVTFLRR